MKCNSWVSARLSVEGGDFGKNVRIREVGEVCVPAIVELEEWKDAALVCDRPGAYPDILKDLAEGNVVICGKAWRAFWIDVVVPEDCQPGEYGVVVSLLNMENGEKLGESAMIVVVKPVTLPAQTLKCTHWFHTDSLAEYYDVAVFSQEYWQIVGNFMSWGVEHGTNMILTPIFTPPLDTEVGGERLTVQLVDVYRTSSGYSFDFSNLRRWVAVAREAGVKYFEISHMFTQWGAKYAPKVMAKTEDGVEERIFGWDTPANSGAYPEFLRAFLPELVKELKTLEILDNCYFHCSDEPLAEHMEWYAPDMALLKELLLGCRIIDALSNPKFIADGIVDLPVPEISHFHQFDEFELSERWCYYCCAPRGKYVNRFIFLQSIHNRIFGALLYKFNCAGFLHWGLNFYNSYHSLYPVNPFGDTTAGKVYPAGDAFIVYPGKFGQPVSSLRGEVFRQALQDQRAFAAIAEIVGRDKVMERLETLAEEDALDFDDFVKSADKFLKVREEIYDLL